MDPVSQGAFGAVFAQTIGKPKDLAKAAVIGAIAGMAPDLDVLIRSPEDSLLALEYHRQFTHSLFFVPIGGLLCSLLLYPLLGKRFSVSYFQILIWCIVGFATHGLLDSCTSYGTQLFWPLTNTRVAWDVIAIIDPLVTLPLITLIVLAARKKLRRYAFIAIAWLGLYFGLATFQHHRAINEGMTFAESRGLNIVNIEAKPSFGNILIWKVITTTEDAYYVDAIKVGFNDPVYWQGDSVKKLSFGRDLPWIKDRHQSQQRKDIERFRWFSKGYIAEDPQNPNRVIDVRYSMLPHQIKPLWGIKLSPDSDDKAYSLYYIDRGNGKEAAQELWQMIIK